jgi:hypothetical protein
MSAILELKDIQKDLVAPAELLPLGAEAYGVYYEKQPPGFWIPDQSGGWTRVNETGVGRYLKIKHNVSKRPDDTGTSEMERTLLEIQQSLHIGYAGKLAGYKAGLLKQNGERILVTSSPGYIEPEDGEFCIIEQFLNGLLEMQQIHFDCWMKLGAESHQNGNIRPGQALVLAGPRDCGKSVLQNQIITPLLGGRMAKPYLFMSGQTSFNSDLFEAEHLMIEDDVASSDIRARRTFGTYIKQFTANEEVQHHAKNRPAITLRPFWRLSISCNEEPENLSILPPMDDSLVDKMIILKAQRKRMPMPTETHEQRVAFQKKIRSELPAYLNYLMSLQIPKDLQASRYGIDAFQNPEILKAMNDIAPEFRLLELIDVHFDERKVPWSGKASALETELIGEHSNVSSQTRTLLRHYNSCGTYLSRLAEKMPDRVDNTVINGTKHYTIVFPHNANLPPRGPFKISPHFRDARA